MQLLIKEFAFANLMVGTLRKHLVHRLQKEFRGPCQLSVPFEGGQKNTSGALLRIIEPERIIPQEY